MTPEVLAALHAGAMTHAAPWSAASFAEVLAAPTAFVLTEPLSSGLTYLAERERPSHSHGAAPKVAGRPAGFAVGRVAGDEAELLTLAVEPAVRRNGIARRLLAAFEAEACDRGAAAAFLEVAEDNAAALALYRGAGWKEAGRRRGYYPRPDAAPSDALVLCKAIEAR